MTELLFSLEGKVSLGSGYGLAPDLVLSSAIWTLLQVVLFQWPDLSAYKMKRIPYLDMRNRMVSFIHGILCMNLCAHYMVFGDYGCGTLTTETEYWILVMSSGYFMYDFLSMAWFGLLDKDMAIHHSLCIIGMVYTLAMGQGACYIVAGLFVAEVSNPPMHMRIMLKHIGLRYSRSYEVAELCYFTFFFIGRIIVGLPAVYATIACEHMNWLGKFVCLGVTAQSFQFLYRMYFIIVRRFAEIKERN